MTDSSSDAGQATAAVTAIARRLNALKENIARIARAAGRMPEDVRLVAVSKTWPWQSVAAALAAGQTEFGESTIQEALKKIPQLPAGRAVWHFIGHLQSNKARFIPGNFTWVHSLDNLPLAERLNRFAAERSVTVSALIQVNITRDQKKHGVMPEALMQFMEEALEAEYTHLPLKGLMTIGPHTANEREQRECFARLRKLREDCRERFDLPRFSELSMGMSDDYPAAIAEGATLVRIGSAIFGERDYT